MPTSQTTLTLVFQEILNRLIVFTVHLVVIPCFWLACGAALWEQLGQQIHDVNNNMAIVLPQSGDPLVKRKRGRPRKSDQVVRVLKEKKDGSVKEKKELRQRSYEDNVSKFMEYSGSNSDKQLFMKGGKIKSFQHSQAYKQKPLFSPLI